MRLFVTVALPGPNYNNAFPPELNITTFQVFFCLQVSMGQESTCSRAACGPFTTGLFRSWEAVDIPRVLGH